MPTLTWIGKKAVISHHKEVPLHLMVEDAARGVGDPAAGQIRSEVVFADLARLVDFAETGQPLPA